MRLELLFLICFVHMVYSRDFYMGMFRKNDFLVAADEVYRPRVPSRYTRAQYGRVFKCPITYFRAVDRLGSNTSPRVEIIRGGLLKKYIVVRFSSYNRPISMSVYVGCENKNKVATTKRATVSTTETGAKATDTVANNQGNSTDAGKDAGKGAGGNSTLAGVAGTGDTTVAPAAA